MYHEMKFLFYTFIFNQIQNTNFHPGVCNFKFEFVEFLAKPKTWPQVIFIFIMREKSGPTVFPIDFW